MLAPRNLALPAVFPYGIEVLVIEWTVNKYCFVVWYGVVGVREYAICIMLCDTFNRGCYFSLWTIFVFHLNPITFIILSRVWCPAHHQSLPEPSLSRSAYPPKSAANLWRGLNATSS